MNVIMYQSSFSPYSNHNVSRRSIFQCVLIDRNRETTVSTNLFADYCGCINPIAAPTLATQCEFRLLILCGAGGIGVAGYVSAFVQYL